MDLLNIERFATRVASLTEYRRSLHEYIKERMQSCAPSLTALIGEQVTSAPSLFFQFIALFIYIHFYLFASKRCPRLPPLTPLQLSKAIVCLRVQESYFMILKRLERNTQNLRPPKRKGSFLQKVVPCLFNSSCASQVVNLEKEVMLCHRECGQNPLRYRKWSEPHSCQRGSEGVSFLYLFSMPALAEMIQAYL